MAKHAEKEAWKTSFFFVAGSAFGYFLAYSLRNFHDVGFFILVMTCITCSRFGYIAGKNNW